MSSSLIRLVRSGPCWNIGKRVLASHNVAITRAFSARLSDVTVPPEDYYHGHLMADQLEYLDDMIEKFTELEASINYFNETHDSAAKQVKWMDGKDIDTYFEPASKKKAEMALQVAELKRLMLDAKKTFAVDAPDGESDGHVLEEIMEVSQIIDDAGAKESKRTIEYQHKMEKKVQKDRARDPEHDW